MDLFSISCTTCKSRLKVREESAIGQILACPKCGGMVMVNPPAGWKKGEPLPAPPAPQSSSALPITTVVDVRRPDETLGDSNFDAVDDLLSDAPPRVRTPSSVSVSADAPGLVRPRFVGAPPPAASPAPPAISQPTQPASTTPTPAAAGSTPAQPLPSPLVGEGPGVRGSAAKDSPSSAAALPASDSETLQPPPPGEANITELPPPDWSPPHPWRYWAMMAGSVAAGIVLALAVVVGMIQFFKGDPQTVAQSATSTPQPITPTRTGTNVPTKATTTPATTTPATTPAANPPAPGPAPAVEPGPLRPVDPLPPEPMPPLPPAAEQDPLGLTVPPQPEVKPSNPADPLAKFDRLIGGDEVPAASADEPMPSAPPSESVPKPPPSDEKPALPRPAPRAVNLAARLSDPLRIETAGTPLADFLQFFQDLSTIPITLEPDGLPLVNRRVESPVVISGAESGETTVGAALKAGLARVGLEYVPLEDQLVVRLIEPEKLPSLSYPVRDLAPDDEKMAALGDMLQALIEPDSWEAAGGEGKLAVDAAGGKLIVTQRRAIHAPLLIACEKLRVARKLPPKTSYDPAFFQLASRSALAKARLETPMSLNFSQPAPLVRIVDYLGQAAGVRILVDWRDIAAAGWNPDGETTLIADKQPLGAALDALLGPMDLTWRVVDGQTIQVLTPEALASRVELEFYKVDGLTAGDPTGEALAGRIQSVLGQGHFREAGGLGELRYDAAGQCLLAALPQPQQRELESLLSKWRSELAAK